MPPSSHFTPPGWHTVTARIVVDDARLLVEFMKQVFDATGDYRADAPAIVTIGDSVVMISDPGVRKPSPAFLYVYVADADATYQRAVDAGARSIEPPADMPYGDRRAMVEDRWGNTWQIATYRGAAPANDGFAQQVRSAQKVGGLPKKSGPYFASRNRSRNFVATNWIPTHSSIGTTLQRRKRAFRPSPSHSASRHSSIRVSSSSR